MENAFVIIALAVLFGLGFIPVVQFGKFLTNNRRSKPESPKPRDPEDKKKDGPLAEFDREGILYFGGEPKQPGAAAENPAPENSASENSQPEYLDREGIIYFGSEGSSPEGGAGLE